MTMHIADLSGADLGTRVHRYDERDVLLYAIAVGASADQLDLVYERNLRVLPTFVLTLGLWAVEAAGALGVYDPAVTLHAAQELVAHRPLPASGAVETAARIVGVWDRGRAAMVDVCVESEWFEAVYSIHVPGHGGWEGPRGTRPPMPEPAGPAVTAGYPISREQAVLYRLTGDRHPVHVDPDAARLAGLDGPILHGLCTLGIAARLVAASTGVHPADLRGLRARFTAPVTPGEDVIVHATPATDGNALFTVEAGGRTVLGDGVAQLPA